MSKKLYIKVGSDSSNDLVIENIDPFHLEFFRDSDGHVFISDLNTISGTRINSKKLDDYIELNKNDRVHLAENIFFDWQKILQEYDKSEEKSNQKTKKDIDQKEKVTKTTQKDYFEIAIIYVAIIFMIWLISLWF
jgi:hypothetical protein